MKPTSNFLLSTYPGRQWSLPVDGDVADIKWFDGEAPTDIEEKLAAGPQLIDLQSAKIAALSVDCRADILSGFDSSALGTVYHYPSKESATDHDQTNLASSVIASLLPGNAADWTTPFWCRDSSGVWAFRDHTAAQIQQVGRDGKARVLDRMAHNASLATLVMAAGSPDDLDLITWASA